MAGFAVLNRASKRVSLAESGIHAVEFKVELFVHFGGANRETVITTTTGDRVDSSLAVDVIISSFTGQFVGPAPP